MVLGQNYAVCLYSLLKFSYQGPDRLSELRAERSLSPYLRKGVLHLTNEDTKARQR